jgi:hypothetical protein
MDVDGVAHKDRWSGKFLQISLILVYEAGNKKGGASVL